MARVHLSPQLRIQDYIASVGLNPNNVFYQEVRCNNISTQSAQWQITSPDKRSLLLSFANIEWLPTYQKQLQDGTPSPFIADADKFSFKPLLPFTQAMTSQTVSINGQSLTFSQPRRFSEPYSRMLVTQEESKPLYETQWWDYTGGNYTNNRPANDALAAEIDEGLRENENTLYTKILHGGDDEKDISDATLVGRTSFSVSHFEPVIVPPFNPYMRCKKDMPDWASHKYQSDVIPNIDRFEFDCQFNQNKIAAGTVFYRYSQNINGGAGDELLPTRLVMTNLQATLHLYWYQVDTNFSIPRSVDLQSSNIREFVTAVDGGIAVPNATLADNMTTTDLLQLRSPPSLILLHAIRRQDAPDYVCQAMVCDSNYDGEDIAGSAGAGASGSGIVANAEHSLDPFPQITQVNVILGDRPNVISASFNQRELYDITVKNSKWAGFPQNFSQWQGPFSDHYGCPTNNDADSNPTLLPRDGGAVQGLAEKIPQLSKSFIALTPADLAEKVPSGVYFPNSLQFTVRFRAMDGACGLNGGSHQYDCYTHVINSANFIRVEPDRASFNEQSLSYGAYEAAVRPDMARDTPGGSLASLREKVGEYRSRYQ